jgi:hypothetical protein
MICAVHPMLETAGNALIDSLRSQTLASVVNFDRELRQQPGDAAPAMESRPPND